MLDILIIGAGTAGLTAAIYAARAGKSVTVLECESIGGQISSSPMVENYPGYQNISGSAFSDALYEQATALGATLEFERAVSVKDAGDRKIVTTDNGTTYECRALIVASGVKHRHLGIDAEAAYAGRGVSYCAICDGAFFRNKITAVVGGGNAALQSAIYLSDICEKVYLIHRRTGFRAEQAVVEKMQSIENIEQLLNKTVADLSGEPTLSTVTLRDTVTGETSEISVNGLFVSIGQVPENDVYRDLITLDESGFIVADESCLTSCPGVFAAGDCRTKKIRQLTTAAADGSVAALAACDYVNQFA